VRNTLTEFFSALGRALDWAPDWLAGAILLAGSALLAWLVFCQAMRLLRRATRRFHPLLEELIRRSTYPALAAAIIFAMGCALPAAPFPPGATASIAHALMALFLLTVGWATVVALNLASDMYLQRMRADVQANLLARKHVTQVHILRRAAQTLIVIVSIGAALMTSAAVRQYGVSLFASAGAAGLIVGLAARPLLSNLLAGIQIAMTQPVRVEDAVIVEGEWGWVETIASTYVVIRTWDWRRLIIPLSYFIEKPFQNWTYASPDLIGSVFLHVDYTVPLQRMREKLNEILSASKLWDGKVSVLQVTDTPGNMIELRVLASAGSGGAAWDLRCEIREKMITFLQAEYPHALPRQRAEITGDSAGAVVEPANGV
jgi:small-conductance mechanosensitive channel